MEEKSKKVFPWKKVVIIAVIVLLVVAMSPLFWMGMLASSFYEQTTEYLLAKSKGVIDEEYEYALSVYVSSTATNIRKYEKETFTVFDFGWSNIKSIGYGYYDYSNDTHYKVPIKDGTPEGVLVITLHLRRKEFKSAVRTMARLELLDCVLQSNLITIST